jgi:hypothetical protein
MQLKDILKKLVEDDELILLSDNGQDRTAGELLNSLSEALLKIEAYLQPGMYIAEINDRGYLGRVLYKIKRKAKENSNVP